ncbi:MAG: TetR/AcrR family transcriptional regulator [Lachnospiraceae bacterium]|nr:TetR/AcrR family transcriptional regulator [Lachnospiraceae bacterium]
MENNAPRRVDRRTAYTKNTVKDAMLELLAEMPFEKITVAALCRRADIVRTTFYLHYDSLTDVIKELADDAILAASGTGSKNIKDLSILAREMNKSTDPELLAPYMSLLPVCQRVADDPKYKVMFRDTMVSDYILMQIYRSQKSDSIKQFQDHLGISGQQAEKLFLFVITGAFEVNKSMGWEKKQDWYEVQKVLLTFISGGFEKLEQYFAK